MDHGRPDSCSATTRRCARVVATGDTAKSGAKVAACLGVATLMAACATSPLTVPVGARLVMSRKKGSAVPPAL